MALGTVFVWFGGLKLLGETSVLSLIQSSYSFLAQVYYLQALGLAETVIGIGVLVGWRVKTFATLMVFHLAGTLLVPFMAPGITFDPSFPVLRFRENLW